MADLDEKGQDIYYNDFIKKRLSNRLSEMNDRRRRLIKYMFKKENRIDQFESQYPVMIRRKDEVI